MHEDEGMRFSDEWTEDSGIRHYVMTDMATGLKTGCIVARNGHFHAHFSIGKTSVITSKPATHDHFKTGHLTPLRT